MAQGLERFNQMEKGYVGFLPNPNVQNQFNPLNVALLKKLLTL